MITLNLIILHDEKRRFSVKSVVIFSEKREKRNAFHTKDHLQGIVTLCLVFRLYNERPVLGDNPKAHKILLKSAALFTEKCNAFHGIVLFTEKHCAFHEKRNTFH